MSGPVSDPQPQPLPVRARRPARWWQQPRGQAVLVAVTVAMAAFSAVMLGTVHGLQNRVARLQRAAAPPFAVWFAPDPGRGGGDAPRLGEAEIAAGLRATLDIRAGQDPASTLAAAVQAADGRVLWTSADLRSSDGRVTLTIPAGVLTRGDYRIVLRGSAGADLVYTFRIVGN